MKLFKSKASRLLTLLGVNTVVLGVALVISTVSWYTVNLEIQPGDNVPSSILTSYFDINDPEVTTGYGTASNPYVITRPVHYYNLVRLHDLGTYGFNENTAFQFGKVFDNQVGYRFYKYNNNGEIVTGEYDTSLNMTYYSGTNALAPLGSAANPFVSQIDGKNLTVDSLSINGGGRADIGIFGFVGEDATVNNLYFNHVDIDTKLPSPTEAGGTGHNAHTGNANVGYIAGHVASQGNFHNVYINNCKIRNSVTNSVIQKNNYGYFGATDDAVIPVGDGDSYHYQLDPSQVNSYFDSNYNSIKNQGLVARKAEYEGSLGQKRVNEAITKNGNNSEYTFKGNHSGDATSQNDYSLATAGYKPNDLLYTVSYGTSHTYFAGSTQFVDTEPTSTPGNYVFYDTTNSEWVYRIITAAGGTVTKTFNCFTISYKVSSTTYYLKYNSGNLISTTTAPNNDDYYFCLQSSPTDTGISSLVSTAGAATYYFFVPNQDK